MQRRLIASVPCFVAGSVLLAACSRPPEAPVTSGTNATSSDAVETTRNATAETDSYSSRLPNFATSDHNQDQAVSEEEFEHALLQSNVLRDWDGDKDGKLTDVEFETSFSRAWDLNGDGNIDLTEYKDGAAAYLPGDEDYGLFEDYDGDGDSQLSLMEYRPLFGKVYQDWDRDQDKSMSTQEFRDAIYDTWDVNGDGVIDQHEYRWR